MSVSREQKNVFGFSFVQPLRFLVKSMTEERKMEADLRHLKQMSEHELADIGLAHSELNRVGLKNAARRRNGQ